VTNRFASDQANSDSIWDLEMIILFSFSNVQSILTRVALFDTIPNEEFRLQSAHMPSMEAEKDLHRLLLNNHPDAPHTLHTQL
jgi:hypothetical protein